MRVYVAASLRDVGLARAVIAEVRSRGHEVTYDWTDTEDFGADWDDGRRARVAREEVVGASLADHLIFLTPGGRGAHVELGAALSSGARVLLVGEFKFSLHYYHPAVTWLGSGSPDAAAIVDAAEALP